MAKQYPADTVGIDGKVYPTIGENIRESAKNSVTAEGISGAIKNNTDKSKVTEALDTTSIDLKNFIVNLLTGQDAYFGGLYVNALSPEQLAQIKTYLGIS